MFCRFCEDLDFDQAATAEGVDHHASCADLVTSANDGCKLCIIIRDEREDEDESDLPVIDSLNDCRIRCLYLKAGPALAWEQGSGKEKIQIAFLHICTTEGRPSLAFRMSVSLED